MVQQLQEIRFQFEQERLLALSGKDSVNQLRGPGIQKVSASGYLLVFIVGQYDSPRNGMQRRALTAMEEIMRRLRTNPRFSTELIQNDVSEKEMRIRLNVKYGYQREEPLEETQKTLLDLQRNWASVTNLLRDRLLAIETEYFEAIEAGAAQEFFTESVFSLDEFTKLARPKLTLTPEEELAVLQRRKERISLSESEQAFVLSQRTKPTVKEPEAPKPVPKKEAPPKKKGIFKRIFDFFFGSS